MSLQVPENKALSWSIIGKSAPILAEITIRKSQALSHQFLAQIHDDELKHAILSNAGNLLIFRVSGHDARFLEDTFNGDVPRKDFVRLRRGEVITRLLTDGTPSTPFIGTVTAAIENQHDRRRQIVTRSRRNFSQPRHVIEERLTGFLTAAQSSETPAVVRRVRQ
jgi:hypothetical protein